MQNQQPHINLNYISTDKFDRDAIQMICHDNAQIT